MQNTVLKSWFLISFHDRPEALEILWGVVVQDPSGRWCSGDYARTSPILEKRDGGVFITQNTEYHTEGPGTTISMSFKDFPKLNQGQSPTEIIALAELDHRHKEPSRGENN